MTGAPLDVFLVVGEPSGDQLGFKLMQALRRRLAGAVRFRGVAGPAMSAEGMESLFPLDDVAVMGFAPVLARFPTIYARAWQTIDAVVAEPPDVLVIIDSPGFTHAVAKRVRRRLPGLPIVDYVSPSVWAWRSGRARDMAAYVDHVLALLPFEPAAHQRLGGPPCTYVGHPLIERLGELRPDPQETAARSAAPPLVLALPGSRSGEVARLTNVFGEALALAIQRAGPFDIVLPTVPRHAKRLRAAVASWAVRPRVIDGEAEKFAAFRRARAALAASGTVTLELALSGVPMVGAYRLPGWEAFLARRLIRTPSVLLPNLILGERAIPELLQEDATPPRLAEALVPLIGEGPERRHQLEALGRLDGLMRLEGEAPSERAARIVLETIEAKRAAR
ncbi:lipid-A-disaccharide synthase [Labrys wisconsinensis]|uniref:Lipid-A-disaccharide synthase n=1 Tax=Labrys wisconsinensis TaxID=425677 RepID=A0ABU0J4W0_9HYPH|nr:lipid-A-disaccharide synthase [Labrys wisconsinensis]MDQ0469302.1 lipid-A-disaccharide synthase [Labrys wisconsinensis]